MTEGHYWLSGIVPHNEKFSFILHYGHVLPNICVGENSVLII